MASKSANTSKTRDFAIDIVRGLAIVTMVGANMAPLLAEPHSWFLRFYGTFAAPIFVTLAGTMVAWAVLSKSSTQDFGYFVQRGAFLILVGALIDIIAWKYLPFVGVDVLYLIGLSMPLLYLAAQGSIAIPVFFAFAIFAATPILQGLLGYIEVPLTPALFTSERELDFAVIVKHWIIDGWFPIFPWLGYGLVGVSIGKWRWYEVSKVRRFVTFWPVTCSLLLILSGVVAMYMFPGPLYSRMGYSELFYPATLGFIALSLGVVFALISLADATISSQVWSVFRLFGEVSLFMYIAHSLVIGLLLEPLWPNMTVSTYLISYAALLFVLAVCAHGLRAVRRRHKSMPILFKWVFGS